MNHKIQRRWLKAIEIAKILFEEEGYHILYLLEIEELIKEKTPNAPLP